MPTYTTNLHLTKPNANENVDISVINDNMDVIDSAISGLDFLQFVYPVGSIYINALNSNNPHDIFGFGTWERIGTGKTIIDAGSGYAAGSTGGSADSIVPYHRHSVTAVSNAITGGSHQHPFRANYAKAGWTGTSPGNYVTTNAVSLFGSYAGHESQRTKTADSSGAVDIIVASTHTHNLPAHNTNYAGTSGNVAGANMPPYLSVYIWKRTA